MSKADVIEVEGKVVEKLPNAMFQVELENGHHELFQRNPLITKIPIVNDGELVGDYSRWDDMLYIWVCCNICVRFKLHIWDRTSQSDRVCRKAFEERSKMVVEGTTDLDNIMVVPNGDFVFLK